MGYTIFIDPTSILIHYQFQTKYTRSAYEILQQQQNQCFKRDSLENIKPQIKYFIKIIIPSLPKMRSNPAPNLPPHPLHPCTPSTLIFQSPQLQSILKLKQKHQKQVQGTITVIQQLNISKLPQKCMQHNNNYSLYCQNDQKPLCASCIYQNQLHKGHRILPLNSCDQYLRRDCEKMEKELAFVVDNMAGLVKHLNEGIHRLDREFPHLVWKIQEEYKNIHNFLVDKEKEHVNELRYHKERMKYQHGALSTELNKISVYIQEKVEQYARKNDNDILIVKRNILDCLKISPRIISEELNLKDEPEPKLHFEVFKEIQDFIYAKLPKLFVKDSLKKQNERAHYQNSSKNKIDSSKSKEKASFSPVSAQKKQQKIQQNTPAPHKQPSPPKPNKSKQKQPKQIKNNRIERTPTKTTRTPTKSGTHKSKSKTPAKESKSKENFNLKPILKKSQQNSPSPSKNKQASPKRR